MNKKQKFKELTKMRASYLEHKNAESSIFEAACHLLEIDPNAPGGDYVFDYFEGFSNQKKLDAGLKKCILEESLHQK